MVKRKRDIVFAFALGGFLEFAGWYPLYRIDSDRTAGQYVLLERSLALLQWPAIKLAPIVGLRLLEADKSTCGMYPCAAYVGTICGLAFMAALWSAGVLIVLKIARFFHARAFSPTY